MPAGISFTLDEPAAALAAIAERLGVRPNRDALARRFLRHPSAQSLRALVEIAPELGLEARAFRSDVPGLVEAPLPAIVHLVEPATDNSAFGILLEREADRLVIQEEPGTAPRTLTRAEFESCWSGIVVTLARREGAGPAPELRRGGPVMRLKAWYRRDDPLDRATLVARRAGLAVFGGLVLASCWSLGFAAAGFAGALAASVVAALAALGIAVSGALFFRSRRALVPLGPSRLSSSICGRGTFTDCLGVLASRFSRFAGIDWASVGIAFFSANLVLAASGALLDARHRGVLFAWLAVAYLLALPGSLALTAVQVYPLRRFCPLCMIVHAVVIVSAALGALYLARGGWPAPAAVLVVPAAAHAAAFLGAFGLVVRYLGLDLESRSSRARLGWIGSTPWGALAEAAGRPRAVSNLPEAAIRVGPPAAPFRLDALVHPMCSGCGPVVTKLAELEKRHAGRVTIGLHLPPRDATSRADHEMCAALAAVGLVAGGTEAVDVFLRVKERPWPVLQAAGGGAEAILADLLPAGSTGASPEALARAREAVEAADRLAETLERGTPTLLVNGRFWDGSVEQLDTLLSRQPDLLASALGVPARGASATSPAGP